MPIDPTLRVEHQHLLNEDDAIDTVDHLTLSVTVNNPDQVPLLLFALEQRVDGDWLSLEIFEVEDVPQDSEISAQLTLDFADWNLPLGRYDLRLRLDYAGERSVYADIPSVDYRAAERLRLALESPTNEVLYFEPVQVLGNVFADRLLALELSAQLENLGSEAPASTLVLSRDGDAFSYSITESGEYRLTITATDGKDTLTESRRFTYLTDQANVTLLHRHPLTPDGEAIDLVDPLELTALVELDERIPLRAFTLEGFTDGVWHTLTTFPLEEVWDPLSRSAVLAFDFGEMPYGLYQVRARVHYADAASTSSDSLLVNYRALVLPSVELSSPLVEQQYLESISLSGGVSWDAVRGTPTLTAHWRQTGEGEPLSGVLPLSLENGDFNGLFTPPAAGDYSLFIRVTDSTGATWDGETVTFSFNHLQSDRGLYMPMDELVDGLLPDLDGFNNAGRLVGNLEGRFEAGVNGSALRFDQGDFVVVEDDYEINLGTGDFSIFVWVKTNRSATQPLVEKRAQPVPGTPVTTYDAPGYTFYLTGAGTPALQMMSLVDNTYSWNNYAPTLTTTDRRAFVADGTWRHVGVTVRRQQTNGGQIYVDGEVVGNFTPTRHSATLSNIEDMFIGRHADGPSTYFRGSLDDLVIVKHAMSDTEIQELLSRARFEVPQTRQLEVTNPTAQELYRSELNLLGSYAVDPGLTPVTIEASVMQASGQSIELPLVIDPEVPAAEFQLPLDCQYFSVGSQNTLQMRLTDGLNQTLDLAPVAFTFTVAPPQVDLEILDSDLSDVLISGTWVRDPACGFDPDELLSVSVKLNDQPESTRMREDLFFVVPWELLDEGENTILVTVADSRDPNNAVATETLRFARPTPSLAMEIIQPLHNELYSREQLPLLFGYVATNQGRVVSVSATLTTDAGDTLTWDISECWQTGNGCPLPEPSLTAENQLEVSAVISTGFSIEQQVDFGIVQSPSLSLERLPTADRWRLGGSYLTVYEVDSRINAASLTGRINHENGTSTPIALQLPNPLVSTYGISFDVGDTQLALGNNEVVVTLDDGYISVSERTFISVSRPQVSILAPENDAPYVGGTVQVDFLPSYAGTHPGMIIQPNARVFLNGVLLEAKEWTAAESTGVYRYSFDAGELVEGQNRVGVQVFDFRSPAIESVIEEVVFFYEVGVIAEITTSFGAEIASRVIPESHNDGVVGIHTL